MDWKAILALAVLVAPLAYCETSHQSNRSAERIACIQAGGEWRTGLSGAGCQFNN